MNKAVAIKRRKLNRPLRAALAAGALVKGQSYFDFGSGRGDDVRLLRRRGFTAHGWDPHHAPDERKRAADVVGMVYVANILPTARERAAALREAAGLARRTLLVAVRADKANGTPYSDGVRTTADTFQANFDRAEFKKWIRRTVCRDVQELEPGVYVVDMSTSATIKPNKRRRVSKAVRAYYAGDRSHVPRGHFLASGRRYPYRTREGRIDCNLLSGSIKRARINAARDVPGAKAALKKGLNIFRRVCAKFVDGATQ
jgi:DNA phosphorothioation-associated putative methyltransferase